MGIIGWIILGLIVGTIAKMIMGDGGGWLSSLIIGIVGALVGGFLGAAIFGKDWLNGFFDLSTWIISIIGACVVLLIYNMVTKQGRRV